MMEIKGRHIKISKLVVMVLALSCVITVISYGIMWNKYSRDHMMQDDLDFQIDLAWPQVQAGMPVVPDDQVERLEAAKAELEVQKSAFPIILGATELMEILLEIASEHHVSISLQTSQSLAGFGSGQFNVLTSSVGSSGSLGDLVTFIQHLEDGPIETLEVGPVNFGGSGDSWTANFNITIYAQIQSQQEETCQMEFSEEL